MSKNRKTMSGLPTIENMKPGSIIYLRPGETLTPAEREVEPGPVSTVEIQSCRVLFKLQPKPVGVSAQDASYGSPDPRNMTRRQRLALQAMRRGEGLMWNVDVIYLWLDRVADYMDSMSSDASDASDDSGK